MAKIKCLSHHEAQKIAAGEVVERPAHIVKELLENAIDASANAITVHIEEAGKQLIRIVDNGCGMDSDDATACFGRHATSKITHVEELETIHTFGFRGEALASIAAVSKIVLITKEEHNLEGTRVTVTGGTSKKSDATACPTGTDITITDLFFNVPARKKFLKSTETEWRAIQLLFNAFCLDYPTIRFSLFHNNKQIHHHPAAESLKQRTQQLWEQPLSNHILPVDKKDAHDYAVEGVMSDHQQYRYDKSAIYFFVNKRWVKNHQLSTALIKGYANVIPEGRYPIAALHISVPAHEVDINIHPKKEEVKFLHPRRIELMIQQTVKETLEQNLSRQIKKEVTLQPAQPYNHNSTSHVSSPFTPFNFDAFFARNTYETAMPHNEPFQQHHITTPAKTQTAPIELEPTQNIVSNDTPHNFHLIGQYNKTYLLLEKAEGLFLLDQHAAHERILYEQFSQKLDTVATVQLLFPHIITLSGHDMEIVMPHLNIFNEHGIIMEQCAQNQLTVQSLPVHLKNASIESLIKEMIGWITEYKSLETAEFKKTINNKLQAQMACKAAVKAGDELSREQMQQLLTDLEKTANRFACPHGRPTGWLLSLHEIEKKFKRRL